MSRVLNADVLSGLFVVLIGAFAYASLGSVEMGVIRGMGPGYLPRALVWLILAAGGVLALRGVVRGGVALPDFQARPLLLISLATVVFGATIDQLGMVVAVVASTVVATLASSITRHRETPILCALLALGAVLVFIKGLGLTIPIWPR
jgi:putative tricarboxylic transport membrane protein